MVFIFNLKKVFFAIFYITIILAKLKKPATILLPDERKKNLK